MGKRCAGLHSLRAINKKAAWQNAMQLFYTGLVQANGLAFLQRDILPMLGNALICRADDLADVDLLLQQVRAPACDTRHSEYRGKEFRRQAEHVINKSTVEIDVGADALIGFALFSNYDRRETFHTGIQAVFVGESLFFRKLFDKLLKDVGARVGNGVDRVAHAID